jgi:hypothetical protein
VDTSLEQQIIEKLHELADEQKLRVLEFVTRMLRQPPSYSARDLLRLPPDVRERLVAQSFEAAAQEDFELLDA